MSTSLFLALILAQTGELPWIQLQDYPTACASNTAITALADSPTCEAINSSCSGLTIGSVVWVDTGPLCAEDLQFIYDPDSSSYGGSDQGQLVIGSSSGRSAPGGRYWPLYLHQPFIDGATVQTMGLLFENDDQGTEAVFGAGAAGAFFKGGEDTAQDIIFYIGGLTTYEVFQLDNDYNHVMYGGLLLDQEEDEVVLRVRAHSLQTTDLLRIQDSTPANRVKVDSSYDLSLCKAAGSCGKQTLGALTGSQTYTWPDSTGTVCLDTGSGCGAGSATQVDHVWDKGKECWDGVSCTYWQLAPSGVDMTDAVLAEFLFAGTDRYDASLDDEFCVAATTSNDTSAVELYDVTGAASIASITLPTGTGLECTSTFSAPTARSRVNFRASVADGQTVDITSAYWVRVPESGGDGGFLTPLPGPGFLMGG